MDTTTDIISQLTVEEASLILADVITTARDGSLYHKVVERPLPAIWESLHPLRRFGINVLEWEDIKSPTPDIVGPPAEEADPIPYGTLAYIASINGYPQGPQVDFGPLEPYDRSGNYDACVDGVPLRRGEWRLCADAAFYINDSFSGNPSLKGAVGWLAPPRRGYAARLVGTPDMRGIDVLRNEVSLLMPGDLVTIGTDNNLHSSWRGQTGRYGTYEADETDFPIRLEGVRSLNGISCDLNVKHHEITVRL